MIIFKFLLNKEKWDGYFLDLTIAWVLRVMIASSILSISLMSSGCSTDSAPRSQAIDLAVKGSYTPGPLDASTRNQTPQGGTDEKSDSTPAKPTQ